MTDEPRAITAEEELDALLAHLRGLARYWAELPNESNLRRCQGLLFSILATLDGVSGEMPGFNLHVSVHPDDKEFCIGEGENWHENGLCLPVDRMWHDQVYAKGEQ